MHRSDTGIVQSGGDRVRLFNLPVFVLDHERACTMDDSHFTQLNGSCRHSGFYPLATGFGQDDLNPFVIDVVVDSSGSVASSAHTGNQVVRIVTSLFFLKLLFYLFADDRLQACHHIRIRVWSYGGTDDVIRIRRMAAPVADGFVRSIFQCHVTRCYRDDCGSQHLHLLYIDMLAFYIRFSHIHDALHVHQGANGGRCHSVLSGTGLGDDPLFAHAACQQNLSDGVVYLVGSCMVQVFPFQIHPATILFRKAVSRVEGRRTSYIIPQQLVEFLFKILAFDHFEIRVFQLFYAFVEYFRHISTSEFSVIAILIN